MINLKVVVGITYHVHLDVNIWTLLFTKFFGMKKILRRTVFEVEKTGDELSQSVAQAVADKIERHGERVH